MMIRWTKASSTPIGKGQIMVGGGAVAVVKWWKKEGWKWSLVRIRQKKKLWKEKKEKER